MWIWYEVSGLCAMHSILNGRIEIDIQTSKPSPGGMQLVMMTRPIGYSRLFRKGESSYLHDRRAVRHVQVPYRYPGQLSGVLQVPRRCPGQLSGVVQKLARVHNFETFCLHPHAP